MTINLEYGLEVNERVTMVAVQNRLPYIEKNKQKNVHIRYL